jgi:hypothetical protein
MRQSRYAIGWRRISLESREELVGDSGSPEGN